MPADRRRFSPLVATPEKNGRDWRLVEPLAFGDREAHVAPDAELAERRKTWKPKPPAFGSGALWRYAKNVGPARTGALTHPGAAKEVRCYADI